MANNDFKSIMVRNVVFKWPKLNGTYRYNSADKRSEECAPTASNAAYSISWDMPAADAKAFYADLKAHYEACDRKETFGTVFGMKKIDDDTVEFRAKRNGVDRSGKINQAPKVIDGMKQPLADTAIWSGSKGSIKVTAFPSSNPQTNPPQHGISLLIDTIQITEAVYGSVDEDFEEVTMDSALDDFGPATGETTTAQAPSEATLEDDEIPF